MILHSIDFFSSSFFLCHAFSGRDEFVYCSTFFANFDKIYLLPCCRSNFFNCFILVLVKYLFILYRESLWRVCGSFSLKTQSEISFEIPTSLVLFFPYQSYWNMNSLKLCQLYWFGCEKAHLKYWNFISWSYMRWESGISLPKYYAFIIWRMCKKWIWNLITKYI